ncbi:hypothetical protein [Microcoleus sp. S13C4]|uniref:hypothetical protein n=1 Tax=Microcoleus sp. S13C4 TaxID=3055410 RepID=UPI002FD72CF9
MSFEEDNTRAFQLLIATQPQLFYKHEAELHQLRATLPDDINQISHAVSNWCNCESRLPILEALRNLHGDNKFRPPGIGDNVKAPSEPGPKPRREVTKETLSNAIQETFPNQSK